MLVTTNVALCSINFWVPRSNHERVIGGGKTGFNVDGLKALHLALSSAGKCSSSVVCGSVVMIIIMTVCQEANDKDNFQEVLLTKM